MFEGSIRGYASTLLIEDRFSIVTIIVRTYADILRVELSGREIIHNLICSKEAKGVGEIFEVFYNSKDASEVIRVVARPRCRSIDAFALERRIDIEYHVYSSCIEDGRTCRVVERGVNIVDADCVDLDKLSVHSFHTVL